MAKKKTDTKTLALIKAVQKQKADISAAEKPNWKTNCSFRFLEGSKPHNLHVVSDIQRLVEIASFLYAKNRDYTEASKALGVEDAPSWSYEGFPLTDWLDDVKMRITKVQIATKKKKLETLETRLNAIVSPELRAEMELEAIAAELE